MFEYDSKKFYLLICHPFFIFCWPPDSVLSKIVIVSIDTSAELSALYKSPSAHLIRLVEWYVDLEEARVGLREALVAHVFKKTELVFIFLLKVHWQAITAPDKFKVASTLLRSKLGENTPETADDFMVFITVRIVSVIA